MQRQQTTADPYGMTTKKTKGKDQKALPGGRGFECCRGLVAAFDKDVGYAGDEEDGEDQGVEGRGVVAFLDEPPVVNDAGDGGDVDEAVEALPVFSSHGAQDEGWRGDGEGEEEDPGKEAYLDEAAFEGVV